MFSDLQRSGTRQLVCFPRDKSVKGKKWIQAAFFPIPWFCRRRRSLCGWAGRLCLARRQSHINIDILVEVFRGQALDITQIFVSHPLQDEAVWSGDMNCIAVKLRVEGLNPGFELLGWYRRLKVAKTMCPETVHLCEC